MSSSKWSRLSAVTPTLNLHGGSEQGRAVLEAPSWGLGYSPIRAFPQVERGVEEKRVGIDGEKKAALVPKVAMPTRLASRFDAQSSVDEWRTSGWRQHDWSAAGMSCRTRDGEHQLESNW
jgi:hypothetical protein